MTTVLQQVIRERSRVFILYLQALPVSPTSRGDQAGSNPKIRHCKRVDAKTFSDEGNQAELSGKGYHL